MICSVDGDTWVVGYVEENRHGHPWCEGQRHDE
jgi:hypothetical protein